MDTTATPPMANETTSGKSIPAHPDEKRSTEKTGHVENANVIHVRKEDFDVYGEDDGEAQSEYLRYSCVVLSSRARLRSVKYRTMVWWKAAALMLAETVSLGVRCIGFPGIEYLC